MASLATVLGERLCVSDEQRALGAEALRARRQSGWYFALLIASGLLTSGKFLLLERTLAAGMADLYTAEVGWLLAATAACWLAAQGATYGATTIGFQLRRTGAVNAVLRTAEAMLHSRSAGIRKYRGSRAVYILRAGLKTVGKTIGGMLGAIAEVPTLLFLITAALVMHPGLAVVTLVSVAVAAARGTRHLPTIRQGTTESLDSGRLLHESLTSLFKALPLVKLYGLGRDDLRRFLHPVVQRMKQGERLATRGMRGLTLQINMAAAVGGGAMLGVGVCMMARGWAEPAALGALLVLHQSALLSLKRALGQWALATQHQDFLSEFMGSAAEGEKSGLAEKAGCLEGPIESVEWCDASLVAGKEPFTGVSCRLQRRRFYGITGPSEWANQKLLRLLADRRRVIAGALLLNGRPIEEYSADSFEHRTFLSKTNALVIDGTLRENLQLAREGASDEEMLEALSRAAFDEDLQRFEPLGGLDARLGQDGIQLSPGQLQRVSIARGLLRAPDVLLLDDPFIALDAPSAHRVLETFRQYAEDHIVVMTANGTAPVTACDELLIMGDDHRFVAQCTPHDARGDPRLAALLPDEQRQVA